MYMLVSKFKASYQVREPQLKWIRNSNGKHNKGLSRKELLIMTDDLNEQRNELTAILVFGGLLMLSCVLLASKIVGA